MKKKAPLLFLSDEARSVFDHASDMQSNADVYMKRYRESAKVAWDLVYKENPHIKRTTSLSLVDGVLKLSEPK